MAIRNRFFLFITFIALVLTSHMKAQDSGESLTLPQVFETLQKKHQVRFNYDIEIIPIIKIKSPPKEYTLKESIQYLKQKTGLLYVLMGNFVLVNLPEFKICGYLKDELLDKPITLATVKGLNNSTITDNNGFFELYVTSKTEKVTISYLGYEPKIITYTNTPKNKVCPTINLFPTYEELSEVVISNYITKGISKLSNGSFKIDFDKFDILPGVIDTDVLQSIQAFPGILSSNETVSNINIRGGTHDQNLILWDNIKMYQSGHFFGLISMYNPQITDQVSLIKNGTDVTLTDGVSGTISMQTDKAVNKELKGSIGFNLIDFNGFIDTPIGKKSSIQIAARKSISSFLKTPTYNEFFERISQDTEVAMNINNTINSDKEFDFWDTSLRWLYQISEKDELRLNFINVNNTLLFIESAVINNAQESRESRLTQNSIAGGLHYKRQWNTDWTSNLEIYETDYKLRAVNANVLDSQRFLQENKVSETSVKLNVNYRTTERLQWLYGYHFTETEITNLDDVDVPFFRSLVSEVTREHGLYSQFNYRTKNKKTTLNTGVRYNYIEKFNKSIWEPRININHNLNNGFAFDLQGEFKHQNTSQTINFQNDFLGIEKRRWQLSDNKDIPIITSKQISLGLSYNKNGWLLNTEGYLKRVKGITTQSQGFQNQYEFIRTNGSYDVKGIDILIRKNIGNVNTWLGYTIMDNNYTFNHLPEETFRSNYDIKHVLTLGTTYSNKNLKLAAGLNWHSGKPITRPLESNSISDGAINYEPTNSSNLKDYLRIDVSGTYDFKLGEKTKANIGISIWNLLNQENEVNSFSRLIDDAVVETTENSLGFTPNVIFRLWFL